MSKFGLGREIASGWRRSSPTATARRSMSGGRRSSSPRPKAAARRRIMRRAGVSKPCVWRWQRRFMEAGVDGLLHDKTRKPGKPPVPNPVVAQLIARTLGPPPGETTHWTSRAMATATGLAVSTVQKVWRAHGLAPHRLRIFKLSRDPQFATKVHDVVGLYVDPPAHSLVLSIDEKSQIQSLPLARTGALDRTQPGLPMKKGRAGTMTHDLYGDFCVKS